MITENKLLTLAIPTYNRASFLDRALCIIQPQLESVKNDVEFIVSDNCSSDNTEEIVKHYIDYGMPIHYIRNEHNVGVSLNIINCYKIAKGKYAWVLGDDDYLAENALQFIVRLLSNGKDYGYLFRTGLLYNKPGYVEYKSKKDFFKNIDFCILWISGSILRKCYIESFPFEKYVNENEVNWLTSALLNFHAMNLAEYNVIITEKIFALTGVNAETSGGYNFFKTMGDLLKLIKTYMVELHIAHKYYYKFKYILFTGFYTNIIEYLLFTQKKTDLKMDNAWYFILKDYYYCPYFYIFIVHCLMKSKFKFTGKITSFMKLFIHPGRWIKKKMDTMSAENLSDKKRSDWRYLNPHNQTIQANDFEHTKVFAGVKTKGDLWVFDVENSGVILRIGNNCAVGQNVHFLLSGQNFKGNIIVGNNVRIGRNTTVYPGVNIGNNVLIMAGSVVTGSVQNDVAIYGNPAKIFIENYKND